ncbi:MAG: hypothetical protein O7F73_06600 [Gammaproteobacteria bacterium]|nr:hypothetical protein [Gammaproteobacteria bacterium]
MRILSRSQVRRSVRAAKSRGLTAILGGIALLLSNTAWPAMSDDAALDLVRAMTYSENSYKDIVLTLIMDGRTLPEATGITMRVVIPFQQRTALARTVLCMSKDADEAQLVTNAAISAVPPGDAVVDEFVSEFVKYQRSSCTMQFQSSTVPIKPLSLSSGGLVSDPTDVSQSR